jgi:hypothetical protein
MIDKITYSFVLYERRPDANYQRIHADSLNNPFVFRCCGPGLLNGLAVQCAGFAFAVAERPAEQGRRNLARRLWLWVTASTRSN